MNKAAALYAALFLLAYVGLFLLVPHFSPFGMSRRVSCTFALLFVIALIGFAGCVSTLNGSQADTDSVNTLKEK